MPRDQNEIARSMRDLMTDQPGPEIENERPAGARCAACRFSVLLRLPPPNLGKQLVCKKGPLSALLAMTPQGPVLLPSTSPPVLETDWCFAFEVSPNYSPVLKNS